jgi:hypothetical protein
VYDLNEESSVVFNKIQYLDFVNPDGFLKSLTSYHLPCALSPPGSSPWFEVRHYLRRERDYAFM